EDLVQGAHAWGDFREPALLEAHPGELCAQLEIGRLAERGKAGRVRPLRVSLALGDLAARDRRGGAPEVRPPEVRRLSEVRGERGEPLRVPLQGVDVAQFDLADGAADERGDERL